MLETNVDSKLSVTLGFDPSSSFRWIVLLDLPHDLFRLADRIGDDDLPRRARPRDPLGFQFG
jgi:hypothetical protein